MRGALAALACGLGVLAGCTAVPAPGEVESVPRPAAALGDGRSGSPGSGFTLQPLPGIGGAVLLALERPERVKPLRYRVIVVPGSGCAGMGAFADRYFQGLLHAQVLVLHKPGVSPQARTTPDGCSREFVRQDRLSTWLEHARAALREDTRRRGAGHNPMEEGIPQLLVGISEGAELLSALAPEVPDLAGLVLLSASGLDPREAGALQARRLGLEADWRALERLQAGPLPDDTMVQGRSLGYWRDMWRWQVALPLRNGPWPMLQAWGGSDALVPPAAYEEFAQRMASHPAGRAFCTHRFEGADHGLQQQGAVAKDGVQRVWAWAEQWARAPGAGLCAPLRDE